MKFGESTQTHEFAPDIVVAVPALIDRQTDPYLSHCSEDIWRILVATDIHLGYLERDPIRGNDSFDAFDEVLTKADQEQVRLPSFSILEPMPSVVEFRVSAVERSMGITDSILFRSSCRPILSSWLATCSTITTLRATHYIVQWKFCGNTALELDLVAMRSKYFLSSLRTFNKQLMRTCQMKICELGCLYSRYMEITMIREREDSLRWISFTSLQ